MVLIVLGFARGDIIKIIYKGVSGVSLWNILIVEVKGFGLVVFSIRANSVIFEVIIGVRCILIVFIGISKPSNRLDVACRQIRIFVIVLIVFFVGWSVRIFDGLRDIFRCLGVNGASMKGTVIEQIRNFRLFGAYFVLLINLLFSGLSQLN